MSKICDRDYKSNAMLSVEMIKGLPHCTLCKKPVLAHGKDITGRALFWALAGDTGISSEAIAAHMAGYPNSRMMPPSDAADRGRCIRLLELIPEWIVRLPEMAKYDKQKQDDGFVVNSSGISAYSNSWSKQIPLIMHEGKL